MNKGLFFFRYLDQQKKEEFSTDCNIENVQFEDDLSVENTIFSLHPESKRQVGFLDFFRFFFKKDFSVCIQYENKQFFVQKNPKNQFSNMFAIRHYNDIIYIKQICLDFN